MIEFSYLRVPSCVWYISELATSTTFSAVQTTALRHLVVSSQLGVVEPLEQSCMHARGSGARGSAVHARVCPELYYLNSRK